MLTYLHEPTGFEVAVRYTGEESVIVPGKTQFIWEWCVTDTHKSVLLDSGMIGTKELLDIDALRRVTNRLDDWIKAVEHNVLMVKAPMNEGDLDLFDINLSEVGIEPSDMMDFIQETTEQIR